MKLSDPVFLGSCVAVGLQHWLWFRHFSRSGAGGGGGAASRDRYGSGRNNIEVASFTEVASFFGICVWLVPFALFVSLSAGENVLPSMGSEYATGQSTPSLNVGGDGGSAGGGGYIDNTIDGKRKNRSVGLVKAGINRARDYIAETGAVMGLWRNENVRPF